MATTDDLVPLRRSGQPGVKAKAEVAVGILAAINGRRA
jgi:hypothetical protein